MVLSALGTEVSVPDTAAVFDQTYEGTGKWAFNVAYAGSRGHCAYLTRLADLQAAEDELARGVAPILSVAWKASCPARRFPAASDNWWCCGALTRRATP
ncbi:hypothetical protein [Deinococcus soli (ex Cha et al. 2016)]|uniref:Uncharacterized protein n=2 Tax=Deinococcus soli (ex Cha et al. 2016) TaxID=1309411 RepID=A0ACC6KHY8_9DEIO|nr:hypothetical protein [Deinococcus soli (ex Cha et al. 2016)]MDR6219221.1 hypothetical protein [Deinococcus soli (ex Cha et al. 2016)]MDR6329470.1 hypothetical protein [Deinococcus soli (ex Cha et al. 2016)]MDR6752130.1 hypothetical protein [Deinococcus soli (ex Cha et al. 2016)]